MRAIVVITTVGTEEQAYLIAREIVARRQAACVNILPGIRSIYRWKGKICKDGELMLLVKTLDRSSTASRPPSASCTATSCPRSSPSRSRAANATSSTGSRAASTRKPISPDEDEDEEELVYAADPDEADYARPLLSPLKPRPAPGPDPPAGPRRSRSPPRCAPSRRSGPSAARRSAGIEAWVIDAGCEIRLSTPPRLSAKLITARWSSIALAAAKLPISMVIIEPKPEACRFWISWPGWSGRPG